MGKSPGSTATFRCGKRTRQNARRKEWLVGHGIDGLPSASEDVTDDQRVVLDAVAAAMQKAGLYSPDTKIDGVRQGIRALVGEIRTGRPSAFGGLGW